MSSNRSGSRWNILFVVAIVLGAVGTFIGGQVSPASAMVQPFVGVTPQRLMETRVGPGRVTIDGVSQGGGALTAAETRHLPILGRGTIPASGVAAVAVNVTAINPSGNGFLTVFPKGATQPVASNLNTAAARTLPNMVVVPLGAGGQISIFNSAGTVDVAVDVLGWFPTGSGFTGATPERLLDTRPTGTTIDGQQQAGGAFGNPETRDLPIAGRGSVPSTGVGAVALNVTAIAPTGAGFLTVFPSGSLRPTASNLNTAAGRTLPNMVIVPLGANGKISIFNSGGTTQLAVDVLGWFPSGSAFTGVNPQRLLDTRPTGTTIDGLQRNTGALAGGEIRSLPVTGRGTIPVTGVGAVALNVTAIGPTATSFLTVFPTGATQPTASNLNTAAGRTVPNMVIVPVGAGGSISIFNSSGSTHLAVDILGWFPAPVAAATSVVSRAVNDRARNAHAGTPIISRNGNKVAFVSFADNLVAGDTNHLNDVFVVDLTTGAMTRASVANDESQLSAGSADPQLSDDGRYVVFTTSAAAVPGDTNGSDDVYRRDLQTGTTLPVSILPAGGQFVAAVGGKVSGDGNVVAFSGSTPTGTGIFVRDIAANSTVLASDGAFMPGGYTVGSTATTSISQDGDKIAVAKQVTAASTVRVFSYDRSAATVTLLSPAPLSPGGAEGGTNPVLSDDGAAVVYQRGGHLFWAKAAAAEQQIDVSTAGTSGNASNGPPHFAGSTYDVLFDSASTNLVAGDTNGVTDVFLRSTGATRTTTRLNLKVVGPVVTQADDTTQQPSMSTNGNLVWVSKATNLAPEADNGFLNVMVQTGVGGPIRVVNRADFTAVAHGTSHQARVSPDGRFVVFTSDASDVVSGPTTAGTHAYVLDRTTNVVKVIGSNDVLDLGGYDSTAPDISDDGTRQLFHSVDDPTGHAPGIKNQVYVVDVTGSSVALVSGPNATTPADADVHGGSISGNGRFVVFATAATNVTAPDSNNASDVFVRDLQTGTVERVSLTAGGAQISGGSAVSSTPSISADGRFVVWTSSATNVVPGAATAVSRVYLRDRQLGTTVLISLGTAATISDDGKTVLVESKDQLLPVDLNVSTDVYLVSLASGTMELVSVNSAEVQAKSGGHDASISPDGRFVTFASTADNLVAGDTNAAADVFLRDRFLGTTVRVSLGSGGNQGTGGCEGPQVSADGRIVVWADDSTYDPGDVNLAYDIYLRDTGVIAP